MIGPAVVYFLCANNLSTLIVGSERGLSSLCSAPVKEDDLFYTVTKPYADKVDKINGMVSKWMWIIVLLL